MPNDNSQAHFDLFAGIQNLTEMGLLYVSVHRQSDPRQHFTKTRSADLPTGLTLKKAAIYQLPFQVVGFHPVVVQ
jgi:hypothetical protein